MTPSTIGRYQIIRPLVGGGMADVYLAHDPVLDRDVAVKAPKVDRLSAETLARFKLEARAVARLEHSSIVPLYDFGDRDGLPYLVTRFMTGGSLADRMGRRPFSLREAAAVIERIAGALDHAHAHGVLHRDVKPGNILFDDGGAAYLADFGIARLMNLAGETSLTQTGLVVGTVAYMSPEQVLGKPLDGRADVYSLGVVLFEMLSGNLPYKGDSGLQQAMQHVNAPIPSIRERRPDLPPAIQRVIERALAKNPGDRHSSGAALAADLRRVAAGRGPGIPTWFWPVALVGLALAAFLFLNRPSPVLEVEPTAGSGVAQTNQTIAPTVSPTVVGTITGLGTSSTLIDTSSPTATPTQTPTSVLPVMEGTPLPPAAVIDPQNAAAIEPLARLGRGMLNEVVYSPDGRLLAVAAASGVYLYTSASLSETLYLETDSPAESVAFSPDGETLAAGTWDSSIVLWRVSDGELVVTLEGHGDRVTDVAFAPDGEILASSSDNTVRLWRPADGELLATLDGHEDAVTGVAFSPDGRILASGSLDKTVRLWQVADGQVLRVIEDADPIISIAFSPNDQTIASSLYHDPFQMNDSDQSIDSFTGTIHLWNATDGVELGTLASNNGPYSSLAFSPDGHTLASGGELGAVIVWDLASKEDVKWWFQEGFQVNTVAYSPDGQVLASGSWHDGTVNFWGIEGPTGQILDGFFSTDSVSFSPDGRMLASTGDDDVARLWPMAGGPSTALEGRIAPFPNVTFSPDGEIAAAASWDGTLHLWRVTDGEPLATLTGHTDWVREIAYSPDGQTLATGSEDGTARLWRIADGTLLAILEGHTDGIQAIEFSPDGQTLATSSIDETARLWRASDGEPLVTLEGHSDSIWDIAFSPDGLTLATASGDGVVRLWGVADGEQVGVLYDKMGSVWQVAYSPDGQLLATASNDDEVARLWRASDGELLATLTGHTDSVVDIAFSPSGRTFATASGDGTARLWRVSDGEPLAVLDDQTGTVWDVTFSPDGRLLASTSNDGLIRLWGVPEGAAP